jgi:hypothetical protein
MVISLSPELEAALRDLARRRGVHPESLALEALREHFLASAPLPADEWERRLLSAASDCGVSLPHGALTSESLYE